VGSESSQKDSMIKLVTTEVVDDTTTVELPRRLVGLNSNGDRLLQESSHELGVALLFDTLPASINLKSSSLSVLAGLLLSSVRIDLLGFNTVGSSVLKGQVREAAIASFTSLVTINKLLFREGN